MRRRSSRIALGLPVALAFALACNALTGVGDLATADFNPTIEGSTSADGTTPGQDAGGTDGPAPLVSCGRDRVCVPSSDGFTPIAFINDADHPCPPEYPNDTEVVGVSKGGNSGCSCDCNPVGGSCMPLTLAYGAANSCAVGTTAVDLPLDGGCASITPFNLGSGLKVTPPATPPTSCSATVTMTFEAPRMKRICGGAAPINGMCDPGESCVPEASGFGTDNCIVHDGDVGCPQPFFRRYAVGADPKDTRACSTCTCGVDGCASTEIELASNSTCFLGLVKAKANGNCTSIILGGGMMKSAKVTNGGGCKITQQPTATGSLELGTPKTVCCR